MEVRAEKSFVKDTKKIKMPHILKKIKEASIHVKNATHLRDIPNLKKLTGSANIYRIRIGEYRIGIIYQDEIVYFVKVEHRRAFYSDFP